VSSYETYIPKFLSVIQATARKSTGLCVTI